MVNFYIKFLFFILLASSLSYTRAAIVTDNELVKTMIYFDDNIRLEKMADRICGEKNHKELQKTFASAFEFATKNKRLKCLQSLIYYAENGFWNVNILEEDERFISRIISINNYYLVLSVLQKKQQHLLEFEIKRDDVDSLIVFIDQLNSFVWFNEIKNYLPQNLGKYLEDKLKSSYNWKILPIQKITDTEPLPDIVINCDKDVGMPGDKVELFVHWTMTAKNGSKERGVVKIDLANDFYIYGQQTYNGDIFFSKRDSNPKYLDLEISTPRDFKKVAYWLSRQARFANKPAIVNNNVLFNLICNYLINYVGRIQYPAENLGTMKLIIKKDNKHIDQYTADINDTNIWMMLHAKRNMIRDHLYN